VDLCGVAVVVFFALLRTTTTPSEADARPEQASGESGVVGVPAPRDDDT